MDKKMKDIFEVLSKEHMMVIRGGFALYDTANDNGKCTASNSNETCDAINAGKKDCHAINHAGKCGALNQGKSCIALNNANSSCTAINAATLCTGNII